MKQTRLLSGLLLAATLFGAATSNAQSLSYHIVGVVRDIPDHFAVAGPIDPSNPPRRIMQFAVSDSDPPLWNGRVLTIRFAHGPLPDGHRIARGDKFSFTIKTPIDPDHVDWEQLADAQFAR